MMKEFLEPLAKAVPAVCATGMMIYAVAHWPKTETSLPDHRPIRDLDTIRFIIESVGSEACLPSDLISVEVLDSGVGTARCSNGLEKPFRLADPLSDKPGLFIAIKK